MAYNALYGFDTSQPLGTSLTAGAGAGLAPSYAAYATPANRQYPKWMTDITARGIGVKQDWTGSTPTPINIPRGDGSGGFGGAVAAPVAPSAPAYNYGGLGTEGLSGVRGFDVAEGGAANPGFEGNIDGGGSYSFADLLGALGLGGDPASGGGSYGSQVPGDWSGTGYANEMQGIVDGMGPTAGSAPLGDVQEVGMVDGGDLSGGGGYGGEVGMAGDVGAPGGAPGMEGFSHGGHVTRNRLQGPDPHGPDDGYGALNIGEGIITAKAMKHYGKGILARLNKLQVPKDAFRKAP